jgi:hypothetical protein
MSVLRQFANAVRLAAILAIAGAPLSVLAEPSQPEPSYYRCVATKAGAYGQVWYEMDVPVDGSAPFHRLDWQIHPLSEGISLAAQWNHPPVNGHLESSVGFEVYFYTIHKVKGNARIEIRRSPGVRYGGEFEYAGPFSRPYREVDGSRYYIETTGHWDELNAWMTGRDAITFALVQTDGAVVAEDRLAGGTITSVTDALLALRPGVEALAKDYRRKCDPAGDVIVTGSSR